VSCTCVLQRGQSGDGLFVASTLCRYERRSGDLFVLSWARVRRCALGSAASVVFMVGAIVCNSLFIFLLLRCVVTVIVWMRFKFCLICAGVTCLCVLMCVVYLLLLNAVGFFCLGVVRLVSG
jgi:hypothetical protein